MRHGAIRKNRAKLKSASDTNQALSRFILSWVFTKINKTYNLEEVDLYLSLLKRFFLDDQFATDVLANLGWEVVSGT